jgi:hypothetical protein
MDQLSRPLLPSPLALRNKTNNMKTNLLQTCLLAVALLARPTTVQAQFLYTTNNGTITISGYTGTSNVVTIPDSINGLPVTSIGGDAFYGCNGLKSVTIPNSVTNIGDVAFGYCTGLTNIILGNSVTSIGFSVFAFCTSLTAITVDAQNLVYSDVNGVLFDKNRTTLIQCPWGKSGNYAIPISVTGIGYYAFQNCTNLTGVTIPNCVTNIGGAAFAYCTSLSSITIPDSVLEIPGIFAFGFEPGAFGGCTSLTNVTIGNSVTNVGDGAFASCTSLTTVAIGNSVTTIEENAFGNCSRLNNLMIPEKVTSIGDWAFYSCTSLTKVAIPASVTNIGASAFFSCTSLTAIMVDDLNPVYSSLNGVLLNKNETLLIEYPNGKGIEYTIPESVTSVGDGAFAGNASLMSVMIGNNVTNIGNEAFNYCTSLAGVYFKGNAPTLGFDAFSGDNNAAAFYLPGTTGWDDFSANTDISAVLWLPQVKTGGAIFGVRSNQFGFNINWASGQTVVVEACTDLANPVWTPVATNNLTSDSVYFIDPEWTNYPSRFYRLRSP